MSKKDKKQESETFRELTPAIVSSIDKLDSDKKKYFVQLYNELKGHISNTCMAARISRQTYYDWLEHDPAFLECIKESEWNLNDEMRDLLINGAGSGDTACLIFYLKSRHPDFKPQPNVINDNRTINISQMNDVITQSAQERGLK